MQENHELKWSASLSQKDKDSSEQNQMEDILSRSLGSEIAAMYMSGSGYRKNFEINEFSDKRHVINEKLGYKLKYALDRERRGESLLIGHKGFVDEILSEFNSLSLDEINRTEKRVVGKLQTLPEDVRLRSEKEIFAYFEFIKGVMDQNGSHRGIFFRLAGVCLKEELVNEPNIDLQRRVAVSAFSTILWPMMKVLSEDESERLQGFYHEKAEETRDFVMQICPDLPALELEQKMAKLKFKVSSMMSKAPEYWEKVGGKYGEREVELAYNYRETAGTVVHETLHALSDNDEVCGFNEKGLEKNVNRMLTEAVVEELASFSEGKKDDGKESYLVARRALAELRRSFSFGESSEIPLSVFVEALFKMEPLLDVLVRNGMSQSDCDKFMKHTNMLFAGLPQRLESEGKN